MVFSSVVNRRPCAIEHKAAFSFIIAKKTTILTNLTKFYLTENLLYVNI
jgi:hypothetical protein